MSRFLVTLGLLGGVASCHPAYAAGAPLTALTPHGTPAAADLIPIQPAAGAALLSATAADLQNYVLTSVKAYGAKGDGVADDTAAIQAAINTGLSIYFPPGTYKTTASLLVERPANDGQVLHGAGSWGQPDAFNGSAGGGATVIKPTSAVTRVFVIDGTPFAGGGLYVSWVQGFGIENLTIDMANMTDDAGHVAINQVQAWDGHYTSVRVINDGNYKRAWLLNGGAFTTDLIRPRGHIIDLEGASSAYEVTTITIVNPDVQKIIANYTSSVTVTGGAIQHPYTAGVTPIVWIPAGVGPYSLGDSSAGNYVAVGTDIKNSQYFTISGTDFEAASQPSNTCTLSGWPYGTYNDLTHGCHKLVMGALVESTALATNITTPQGAGMYFADQGIGSTFNSLGQSGVVAFAVQGAIQYNLSDLRVAGALSGPVGFGGALGSETGSSYAIVGSTGAATFRGLTVRPATDGAALLLSNAAGTNMIDCATNVLACAFDNGVAIGGYSDNFTTQTWSISAAAGLLKLYSGGAATITLTGANGNIQAGGLYGTPIGASLASTGAFTTLSASSTVSGSGFSTYLASPPAIGSGAPGTIKGTTITATTGVVLPSFTYATLPASPVTGEHVLVTDASTCTFNSAVTAGSGAYQCPVTFSGSAWVAG